MTTSKNLVLAAQARKAELKWRYGHNRVEWLSWRRSPLSVRPALRQAQADLCSQGIAVFHCDDLIGGRGLYKAMVAELRQLESSFVDHNGSESDSSVLLFTKQHPVKKPYNTTYSPQRGPIHSGTGTSTITPSALSSFALHPDILSLVTTYTRYYLHLFSLEYWRDSVTEGLDLAYSQRWHRDGSDLMMMKAFMYLDDVDDSAGPFCYISGTDRGRKRLQHAKPTVREHGDFVDDADMIPHAAEQTWRTVTGRAGTIFLANTKGYHKGGRALERDRRTAMAAYKSERSRLTNTKSGSFPVVLGELEPDGPALRFAANQE